MMLKFKITTDREYYERFGEIADRIRSLGILFQNPDTIVDAEELTRWEDIGYELEWEFEKLIYEAQNRVTKLN
jgi:beta-phosphoglucomutase-like phosphatase (HAD superfamily)